MTGPGLPGDIGPALSGSEAAGKLWPRGLSILLKTEGLLVRQALALAQEQPQQARVQARLGARGAPAMGRQRQVAPQPKQALGWARALRAVGLAQWAQWAPRLVAEAQGKVGAALAQAEAILVVGLGRAMRALGWAQALVQARALEQLQAGPVQVPVQEAGLHMHPPVRKHQHLHWSDLSQEGAATADASWTELLCCVLWVLSHSADDVV